MVVKYLSKIESPRPNSMPLRHNLKCPNNIDINNMNILCSIPYIYLFKDRLMLLVFACLIPVVVV